MRIAHLLATAGIDSRRKCEELVLKGYVQVNGKRVTDLGRQVDTENDMVMYRGHLVRLPPPVFIMLHKPRGYAVTSGDPHAKKTVYDLLPTKYVVGTQQALTHKIRIFAVGRLEKEISGLLLFTNDGDLAHQLTHPKFGVSRFYEVRLHKAWEPNDGAQLLKGIHSSDGKIKVKSYKQISPRMLILELQQGKTGHLPRLFRKLNYNVQAVRRIGFGPVGMGDMPSGASRFLTKYEVQSLRDAADPSAARVKPQVKPAPETFSEYRGSLPES